MSSATSSVRPKGKRSPFETLGRGIARHPWYGIAAWIIVLAVSLPAVMSLGSVLSSSNSSPLPGSDMSVLAQNQFSSAFPNSSSAPSSTFVLLVHPNITSPSGENATLAVAQAIQSDPKIHYVGSVEDLYSAYGEYLTLDATVGLRAIGASLAMSPSLPVALNQSAQLVWGAPATYVQIWNQVAGQLPANTSAGAANWPAFQEAQTALNSSAVAEAVLANFYNGYNASVPGFNGTVSASCLGQHNIVPCADASERVTFPLLLPSLLPNVTEQAPAITVLQHLGIENLTNWPSIQQAGAALLGPETGLPASWVYLLWRAFPTGQATESQLMAWTVGLAESLPLREYPFPVPNRLMTSFVNPAGNATLLVVSFTQDTSYTENGTTPVYTDVDEINSIVPATLASSPEYSGVVFYQSGPAPLEEATLNLANSALSVLLLLTIAILVIIMIIYFRAPGIPLVAFGAITVALLVSMAGLYVLGTLVTNIDPILESIILIFILAIGTDYSVFMVARYKEELVRHENPRRALIASVQWAGQSITTSGLTVIVVGVSLSLSGINLLEQLGMALALSVVILLLAGLTLTPSILRLVGPRVFWPYTKEQFRNHAAARRENIKHQRTYFTRAARLATRRPVSLIVLVIVLSAPIAYLAFQVPISYDLTNIGLPPSNPAQAGFTKLSQEFGPAMISPSFVLVTFSQPLFPNGSVNLLELRDVAALDTMMNTTAGIAQVDTLVGAGGAPLSAWENLSKLSPASQASLFALEGQYVGVDGRTVLFNVATTDSGYSAGAGTALSTIKSDIGSYRTSHSEMSAIYYGGAAQQTQDYEALTSSATEWMLIGASIGLFLVLLVLLDAIFVPLLALAVIGLSILWSWAVVYLVVGLIDKVTIVFLLPVMLLVLILGLGMDYNALFLTRVKEERLQGYPPKKAIRRAVTHVGGVITAAAVMLGAPFVLLGLTSPLGLIAGAGLGIGMAVLMQSFVAQTYVTPAVLTLGRNRIWWGPHRKQVAKEASSDGKSTGEPPR